MRRIWVPFLLFFLMGFSVFAISLISNPPESLVYVNGVLVGQTNANGLLTFNAEKGAKVEVESVGYFPYTFIYSCSTSTIHVKLSPISYLSISATPTGAEAVVDGNDFSLPATITLPAGKHSVTVTRDGYVPQSAFVTTQPFGLTVREFTLQKAGKFLVRSVPAHALVSIDGEEVGMTPFSTYLQNGEHLITLSASGYSNVSTTVYIAPHSSSKEIVLKLKKLFTVTIFSSPSHAVVSIASTTFTAPATLELVGGTYVYSATQCYAYPSTGVLKIERNGKYTVKLHVKMGMVVFTSNPMGAAVKLNGKFIGQTQKSLKLPYGEYRVKMVGPGGSVWFGNFVLDQQIKTVYGDMINSGMVLIRSQPSSGTIVHIGQVWTTSPATLNAAVGVYKIEFFNPNFPPLYRYVQIKAGKVSVVNVSLEPMSTFFVVTKPLGAKVMLDGKLIGYSPLFAVRTKAGEHLLSIQWPDGKLEKKLLLVKDRVYTFDFTDPNSVKVEFVSYPDPLRLKIDGKFRGYTPISIQLTRGKHTYEAYDILGNEMESGTLNTTYLSSETYFFLNGR